MLKVIYLSLLFTIILQAKPLPLEGREYGVALNLTRFLTYSDSWKSASGSFSYFNQEEKIEIAFPWHIAHYTDQIDEDEEHFDVYNLDIHYRKFLGEEMDGFYLSGFTRLSYLNGLASDEESYIKTPKLGLGVGIGYRILPKTNRYYWGVGLIVGSYVLGDNYRYKHVGFGIEDAQIIVDIELLKFGYAF